MKFIDAIKNLNGKPSQIPPYARTPKRVVRVKQEDVAKRLRKSRPQAKEETSDSTPVFSNRTQSQQAALKAHADEAMTLAELKAKWDEQEENVEAPEAKPMRTPAPPKVDRSKTRLLGFDSEQIAADPFAEAHPTTTTASTKYPVGWLVITDGPGCGESFTLLSGMSQIGRGSDQTICLDFGDAAISRSNHAAIVYDTVDHSFHIGHGGKANIVRINDRPLISNETLVNSDTIKIGETTMQLVVFSTPEFNWITPSETHKG